MSYFQHKKRLGKTGLTSDRLGRFHDAGGCPWGVLITYVYQSQPCLIRPTLEQSQPPDWRSNTRVRKHVACKYGSSRSRLIIVRHLFSSLILPLNLSAQEMVVTDDYVMCDKMGAWMNEWDGDECWYFTTVLNPSVSDWAMQHTPTVDALDILATSVLHPKTVGLKLIFESCKLSEVSQAAPYGYRLRQPSYGAPNSYDTTGRLPYCCRSEVILLSIYLRPMQGNVTSKYVPGTYTTTTVPLTLPNKLCFVLRLYRRLWNTLFHF